MEVVHTPTEETNKDSSTSEDRSKSGKPFEFDFTKVALDYLSILRFLQDTNATLATIVTVHSLATLSYQLQCFFEVLFLSVCFISLVSV
jgi:hypothetical protein